MSEVAKVYYLDSLGRVFDFMVDSDDITTYQNESSYYYAGRILDAKFHDFDWKSETYDSRLGDRVLGWTKDAKTYSVTLLFGGSYEERKVALDIFHEAIENDIRQETPGTLIWNDWYVDCYIVSSETTPSQTYNASTENKIDIYCPKGLWKKRSTFDIISEELPPDPSSEPFTWDYAWGVAESTKDKVSLNDYPIEYTTQNNIDEVVSGKLSRLRTGQRKVFSIKDIRYDDGDTEAWKPNLAYKNIQSILDIYPTANTLVFGTFGMDDSWDCEVYHYYTDSTDTYLGNLTLENIVVNGKKTTNLGLSKDDDPIIIGNSDYVILGRGQVSLNIIEETAILEDALDLESSDYTYTEHSITVESQRVEDWLYYPEEITWVLDTTDIPYSYLIPSVPDISPFIDWVTLLGEQIDDLNNPIYGLSDDDEIEDKTYGEISPEGYENPSELGWYENTGTEESPVYVLTSDTTLVEGKSYYLLLTGDWNYYTRSGTDPDYIYTKLTDSEVQQAKDGGHTPVEMGWYEIMAYEQTRETLALSPEDYSIANNIITLVQTDNVMDFIQNEDPKTFGLKVEFTAGVQIGSFEYLSTPSHSTEGIGDYEYDYLGNQIRESTITNYLPYSLDWECVINGPAYRPTIVIGDNLVIELDLDIGQDEYVTINSIDKTIIHTEFDGEEVNVFGERDTTNYIFERLPGGPHRVTWNGDYSWTFSLIEERSEPEWS